MNIYINSLKILILTYSIYVIPLTIYLLNKKIYTDKKKVYKTIFFSITYGIIISGIIYIFPKKFFSLFTNIKGVINYCTYAYKILFFSGSIIGIQIIVPIYFCSIKKYKKTALLYLIKITVLFLLIFILYPPFHIKGLLFAIPISDIIFTIICLIFIHLFI